MKKLVLFIFGILMMVSTTEATNGINHTNETFGVNYRYNEAVTFIERGIRFHVFLNGDFDFDSQFYLRNRWNNQVPIFRDFRGRITRVGNVRIRYNLRGDVRRIGSVLMNYRRGWLQSVGNLTIQYNRWGDPLFFGQVHWNGYYNNFYYGPSFGVNFNWNIGRICPYNDPFFYGNQFRNNYRRVRQDANYIYYRRNEGATGSGDQIIRRRRAGTANSNTNTNTNTNTQTLRNRRGNTATNNQTVRDRRGNTNVQNNTNRRRVVQNSNSNNNRRVKKVSTNSRTRPQTRPQTRPTEINRQRVVRKKTNSYNRKSQVKKKEVKQRKALPKKNTSRRSSSRSRS